MVVFRGKGCGNCLCNNLGICDIAVKRDEVWEGGLHLYIVTEGKKKGNEELGIVPVGCGKYSRTVLGSTLAQGDAHCAYLLLTF